MLSLLTHIFLTLFFWPKLRARFDAPPATPRPVRRPLARQWTIAGLLGRRFVAVRVQLVAL